MEQSYYGTGRRKTSVARVYLKEGKGKILVNNRDVREFFKRELYIRNILEPLKLTNKDQLLDVKCFVNGGGSSGQADAVKLGIARALLKVDADLRPILKAQKVLTRDPREVERKKYGQKGARARFQYSKR